MKIFSKLEILNQVKIFLIENPKGVLEVLGPTTSGKTGFSVEMAHWVATECGKSVEIISVDSRQIFRGCDISSAKITTEEMQEIPHHGLDLVDLDQDYNVVKFQQYAFDTIEAIQSRGNVPVLCGGTTLWLDAVSENYIFSEDKNDAGAFAKSTSKSTPKWPVFKIGLHWDRAILYDRINQRAVDQFENGLIEETKNLMAQYGEEAEDASVPRAKGLSVTRSAWTSFGYKEIKAHLEGNLSYEEALSLNQKRNRNYAKRQLTWWRGREDVNWLQVNK